MGYLLLGNGHFQRHAILTFDRKLRRTRSRPNAYDSLGEAYMKAGPKMAIVNYKKSLQLDPGNQNAVGQLKKLQEPN